jgi:hypothetical protein
MDQIKFTDDDGEDTLIICLSAAGGRSYTHNTDEAGDLNYATREWVNTRKAAVIFDTTTSRTLSAATDHGAVIVFTNASPITVTAPFALGTGFHCTLIQQGTGQVTLVASGGATLNSFGGLLKTAGPDARVSVVATAISNYNISGTLVA